MPAPHHSVFYRPDDNVTLLAFAAERRAAAGRSAAAAVDRYHLLSANSVRISYFYFV